MNDLHSHTYARVRVLPELERAADDADDGRYDWLAEISSTRLDAYFGRMDAATTLRNFADEAAAGVAFLEGHRHFTLPFGRSYDGRLFPGADVTRVESRFYTMRGLTLPSGISSDEFIRRVESGIQQDVSVGFHGGRFVCDICGGNVLSWNECPHIPGWEYEVSDPATNRIRSVLATFLVVDGHLSEVSAVYDGATPGATIRKAETGAAEGRLNLKQRQLLESRYRIRLPDRAAIYGGIAMPPESNGRLRGRATPPRDDDATETPPPVDTETRQPAEEQAAPDTHKLTTTEEQAHEFGFVRTAQTLLDEAGAPADLLLEQRLRWLIDERQRLIPLADIGRQYRSDLIAQALADGVRAHGNEFAEETYRSLLEAAPLETIRRMATDWHALARERLVIGRQTVDDDDDDAAAPAPARPVVRTPDDVYRA